MKYLAIDQWGGTHFLNDISHKGLIEKFGKSRKPRIRPIYQDTKDGQSHQMGYMINQGESQALWLTIYELKPFHEIDRRKARATAPSRRKQA